MHSSRCACVRKKSCFYDTDRIFNEIKELTHVSGIKLKQNQSAIDTIFACYVKKIITCQKKSKNKDGNKQNTSEHNKDGGGAEKTTQSRNNSHILDKYIEQEKV